MVDINLVISDFECPFCGLDDVMKKTPASSKYSTYIKNAYFCSSCGRQFIARPVPEKELA